jgi:hypothetical protein
VGAQGSVARTERGAGAARMVVVGRRRDVRVVRRILDEEVWYWVEIGIESVETGLQDV